MTKASDSGWMVHEAEQRLAWLKLTHAQRLAWLEDAKRFAQAATQATKISAGKRDREPGSG